MLYFASAFPIGQYTFWDKLKQVDEIGVQQSSHLARMFAHLIANASLSLTILKVPHLRVIEGEPILNTAFLGVSLFIRFVGRRVHPAAASCSLSASTFDHISIDPLLRRLVNFLSHNSLSHSLSLEASLTRVNTHTYICK